MDIHISKYYNIVKKAPGNSKIQCWQVGVAEVFYPLHTEEALIESTADMDNIA